MSDKTYPVTDQWKARAFVDDAAYRAMYARSLADPDGFWAEHGRRIDWIKPFTEVKDRAALPRTWSIKWFRRRARTNVDGELHRPPSRHARRSDAIIWEGDDPSLSRHITYRELHGEVCRFANVLLAHGVKKADTVTIYMPMIPEAAYAMLACARIGAVHSVVFGGFSPESLAGRINDCKSQVLITADEGLRGGRKVAAQSQCR